MTLSYVSNLKSLGVVNTSRFQQKYGISEESFNDIQRLTSSNHSSVNTSGSVINNSRDDNSSLVNKDQLTLSQSITIKRLEEALQSQSQRFEHYKSVTEIKISALSKDLLDLSIQLKEAKRIIAQLQDKLDVAISRKALADYQKGDSEPFDKPIDRNGVAPKDVVIEKIFNFSNHKF